MSFPLQNARLCLDCDTVFDEPQCPGCGSQSYFPLSRWVRPAMEAEHLSTGSKAKKASLVLLGSGAAYAIWKFFQKPDEKTPEDQPPQPPTSSSS